jgi:hypothetical protein
MAQPEEDLEDLDAAWGAALAEQKSEGDDVGAVRVQDGGHCPPGQAKKGRC